MLYEYKQQLLMKCEEGRDEGERWWGKGAEGEDDKEKGAATEARWVNRRGKIKKKERKKGGSATNQRRQRRWKNGRGVETA